MVSDASTTTLRPLLNIGVSKRLDHCPCQTIAQALRLSAPPALTRTPWAITRFAIVATVAHPFRPVRDCTVVQRSRSEQRAGLAPLNPLCKFVGVATPCLGGFANGPNGRPARRAFSIETRRCRDRARATRDRMCRRVIGGVEADVGT